MIKNEYSFLVNPQKFEIKLENYIDEDDDDFENFAHYYSINNFFISPDNQYIAIVILNTEHKPTCYSSYEYFPVIQLTQTSEQIYRGNPVINRYQDQIICQYSSDSSLFLYEEKNYIIIYDITKKEVIKAKVDYEQIFFLDVDKNLFLSQNFELIIYSLLTKSQKHVNFDTDDKLIQGFNGHLIYQISEKHQFFLHDYKNNKSLLLWKGQLIKKFIVYKQFILEITYQQKFRITSIQNKKLIRKQQQLTHPYINYEINQSIIQIQAIMNSKIQQECLEVSFFDTIKGTQKIYQYQLSFNAMYNIFDIKLTTKVYGRLVDRGYLEYYI